ncbi:hypothetical protein VSH64_17850 [Amycolatopsis rhabdoformis]|uniref:DUF3040 domain-containing protein n=1 Tax=Amycolatopsis rhabdoformis TaxID=1448059 RepID=A0ABZ1IHT2_9PSEU|nr:hypothetical protein [Amycolatopsis rhabdoformis]WSE33942.1 hypothetical protein VSH64_17850 [Amycolatopsis rhabdoformis]
MAADPRPRLTLHHLTESRADRRTSPLTVARPETGYASAAARCQWCSADVELRVASAERFLQTRRQWAFGCAAALLTVVVGVVLVVATPLLVPAVVLLIGGFLAAVVTAFGWWWATGVRPVRGADGKPGPHVVRPDRS